MNAAVLHTMKQRQWFMYWQVDICSQLEVDVQSIDLFVWTLRSNSLQTWADSWSKLHAMNVMYSPVADMCGLCHKTACRDELTPEPNWTLMSPINDWVLHRQQNKLRLILSLIDCELDMCSGPQLPGCNICNIVTSQLCPQMPCGSPKPVPLQLYLLKGRKSLPPCVCSLADSWQNGTPAL